MTFQLRSLILEHHLYFKTVFSQTIDSIELKFNVKTPYDKLAKMYTKYHGHLTKMTAMPIYGKKTFKNLLQNQEADDLGTNIGDV